MRPREYALACHDILAMIFDHLALTEIDGRDKTEESRQSCRKALASSAVTCTTLSHHALNVLWRQLDIIHPLLRILPNCKCVDSQLTLSGAISDESWTRFQLYAHRVRVIAGSMEPKRVDAIHPSVWGFLAAKCKGSPLMPRLRTLLALDVRLSDISALVLLMSPSLRTLDMFFALEQDQEERRVVPHVVTSLMESLPLMAPNLESIYCDVDIEVGHGYIEAFRHLTHLNTLSITSLALGGGALHALSTVATLRDLSCSIDLSDSSALTLRPYKFQYLVKLKVTGPFDDLIALFDACQLPSLTQISLPITKPPTAGEPVDFFAAVCRCCNRTLLTSFSTAIKFEAPSPHYSLMQYFEPLLAFHNIKTFCLSSSPARPPIHDDDLARFGAAWPRLAAFQVAHYPTSIWPRHDPVVRPTLSGLVDLARRCPRLEAFRAPILVANVVPAKTAVLPLGHGLRSLLLNNITLPATGSPAYTEVAMVLDRVFPSIDLEDAQKMARSHAKGWKQFLGVLADMRLGRAKGVGL